MGKIDGDGLVVGLFDLRGIFKLKDCMRTRQPPSLLEGNIEEARFF